LETSNSKQNSREIIPRETAKVANRQETIVRIPIIVPPIEVELALRVVLVEIRHVAIAIDLGNGALYEKPSMPPFAES
jgi:hypothetical protein